MNGYQMKRKIAAMLCMAMMFCAASVLADEQTPSEATPKLVELIKVDMSTFGKESAPAAIAESVQKIEAAAEKIETEKQIERAAEIVLIEPVQKIEAAAEQIETAPETITETQTADNQATELPKETATEIEPAENLNAADVTITQQNLQASAVFALSGQAEDEDPVKIDAEVSVNNDTGVVSIRITSANESEKIGFEIDGYDGDIADAYKGDTVTFKVSKSGTYPILADYYGEELLGYGWEGSAKVELTADAQPQEDDDQTPAEEMTDPTMTEITRASGDDTDDGKIAGKITFTGLRSIVVVLNDSKGTDLKFITLEPSTDGSAVTRSFDIADLAADIYTVEFYFKGDGTSGLPPTKTTTADLTPEAKPEPPKPAFTQIEASVSVDHDKGTFTVTVTSATAGEQMIAYVDGLSTQDQALYVNGSATFVVEESGDYALEIDYLNSTDSSCAYSETVTVNGSGTIPEPESKITDTTIDVTPCNEGETNGAISGTVEFTGTKGLIVRLYEGSTQIGKADIAAGSSGKFAFDNLASGEYALHIYFEDGTAPVYSASPYVMQAAAKAKAISAAATVTDQRIDVTVSDASALPITVSLIKDGSVVKTADIAAGIGSVSFENLAAGTYSVSVNYNPAQDGVSAVQETNLVVSAAKPAAIVISSVKSGENLLTISGTAQKNMQLMITTTPSADATYYTMTGEDGKFTVDVNCAANTYTKVTVQYSGDTSSAVTMEGEFVVTAPATQPTLTVDPIDASSTTVVAKTTAGVVVEIRTSDYTQKVTADAQGIVRFSLPHTYAKGTKITFIVYYGTNNAQSFESTVTVDDAPYYGKLEKGDKGDAVKKLTTRLAELGYPVKPTSTFDGSVERAVILFQEANGLDADGEAGRSTQAKLFSVSAIRYGERRYPTLVRGDRDLSLIYTLQQRLKDLGYYTIKVDGIFGSGTQRAVRDFQKVNGLTVTGKADDATQRLLYSSSAKPAYGVIHGSYKTLQRSSKYQSAVVPLQRRLKALGYYSGSIDGYFGSQTYRAVRNFQKRNGIDKTGKADPYTQQILYSSAAKPASGSSSSSSSGDSSGYRLLYWGCEGSAVKRLQNALINAGYKKYVRTADGIYGQWTYDAVCAYQKDHGLSVDGIAGKKTQNSLYGTNY